MDQEAAPSVRSNIAKLYALEITGQLGLVVPIIIPFYGLNGLGLREALLLEAIFSLIIVILEIPSGYLSDRWGRQRTIVVGSLCIFLGVLLYCLGTAFSAFLIGEIFWAIGASFHSGTIEALTYDTLLELKEEHQYRRVYGQQRFLFFAAEAAVATTAGFFASGNMRLPFWITLGFIGSTVLISLTLIEPQRHKKQETRHIKALVDVCCQTMRMAPLRSIIMLYGFIGLLTLSLFWFTQPYQIEVGLPVEMFGITHAAIVIAGALAAKFTHSISRIVDDRLFLITIAALVIMSYIALGMVSAMWGLVFFLIGRMAWGCLSPLVSDIINRMTRSEVRATVLSTQMFFSRLLFASFAPFWGYLADFYSLRTAIVAAGALGTVTIVSTLLAMRRVWAKIPR